MAVPPILLNEQQVFTFKFWFNGKIQCGILYQNELFCQLGNFDYHQGFHFYQVSCQLAQQGALLAITCSPAAWSLWGNLRTDLVKQILIHSSTLN